MRAVHCSRLRRLRIVRFNMTHTMTLRRASRCLLSVWLISLAMPAGAQPSAPKPDAHAHALAQNALPAGAGAPSSPHWSHREGDAQVHIGENAHVPADEPINLLVAVLGNAHTEGPVSGAVISVFGNARADGPVGEAVVALFGNVYVDAPVGHDVVAVFGNVELGPNARVSGEVVSVDGELIRDPASVVAGAVRTVSLGAGVVRLDGFRPWVEHALLYGRPLAIHPDLNWAWGVAFSFLAFYILLAVLMGDALDRCVRTIEQRPGPTILTAILSAVLTPIAFALLVITVLGVLAAPLLGAALFFAALFGKAVVLAWLGRRVTRVVGPNVLAHTAFAVLVGGLMVIALYLVPVLGFILMPLLTLLGVGAVLYTLMLTMQTRRDAAVAAAADHGVQTAALNTGGMSASTADAAVAQPAVVEGVRAGFWIRMAALAIDALLIGLLFGVLEAPDDIYLLALAGYGLLMWRLKSTTVGGLVCRLQVVRKDGREMSWDTSIVRALSCFLSLAAAGLGFIWIAFDAEKQAWHDRIAGTVVIRRPASA